MERSYFVIDVFTSEPFTGNAAAVVLDADGLSNEQMRVTAAEFNCSETTFVLAPQETASGDQEATVSADGHVRFRWFTPTTEVAMCGHATIAGVHALIEYGRIVRAGGKRLTSDPRLDTITVCIETQSGILTAFVERIPGRQEAMIWLDLIDPILTELELDVSELADALRVDYRDFDRSLPFARTQDADLLVFVRSFRTLNESKPDFDKLARLMQRLQLRGLSLATVHTPTPVISVQSRFFAPTAGIDEDPVTGSVHGPLAAYLVQHGLIPLRDGIAGMTCSQGRPGGRTGIVHALVQPNPNGSHAVRIGGRAVTTMRGTLYHEPLTGARERVLPH